MNKLTLEHIKPYKTKPLFHISITGEKFPYYEYACIKEGTIEKGFKGLPENGYPYIIEYEEWKPPAWFNKI